MARHSPDALQSAGERLLAEWGIAGDADPAALTAVLGRDVAADVAIAHRLGALASDESLQALAALERTASDKRVRREAKRALYRLEQRGLARPASETPASPAPVLGPAIEGYVSAIDGQGDQLVWLVKPQPGGVAHLFAVLNDPDGLREVTLHTSSRKALRELRDALEARHEIRLAAVDWRYADFLIHRAFAWARAANARMTGDYPGLRAQLTSLPAAETSPLPLPTTADVSASDTIELLTEPELRTWFRPAEQLAPFLEEIAAIQDSPLVLNEAQQQERYEAIVARARESIFDGPQRAVWARRLTGMAHYFAATRRPARAAQAASVAAALGSDRPVGDIPFVDQLVRTSLAFFVRAAAAEQAERSKESLIVTPQQARRTPPRR